MREITCSACGSVAKVGGVQCRVLCRRCYLQHNEEGRAATLKVGAAVRNGALPRADECACVDCGKPARDYDHRDYTRPLDVQPVCRTCNQKRGQAFNSFWRPSA